MDNITTNNNENSSAEKSMPNQSIEQIIKHMEKEFSGSEMMTAAKKMYANSKSKLQSASDTEHEETEDDMFGITGDINADKMQQIFGAISSFFGKLAQGEGPMKGKADWDAVEEGILEETKKQEISESNRIRLSELFKVAAMNIDLALHDNSYTPRDAAIMTKGDWCITALRRIKPMLKPLTEPDLSEITEDFGNSGRAKMAKLSAGMISTSLAVFIGAMLSRLSETAFGNSALPVPSSSRSAKSEVAIVEPAIIEFAENNSLELDEAALWVCCNEILFSKVFSMEHIGDVLWALCSSFIEESMDNYTVNTMMDSISSPDEWMLGEDEESMEMEMEDLMEKLIANGIETTAQERIVAKISAVVSAIAGYAHLFSERITNTVIGNSRHLSEAFIDTGYNSKIGRHVFGIHSDIDAGLSFVSNLDYHGVLNKLWKSEDSLPTPEELETPSLWMKRMNLVEV